MKSINNAYAGLSGNYLFSEVARRVSAFKARRPETEVISLGIGDVSQPLAPAVISALHKAVDEMARPETFRGYGPEQGYAFLREAILRHDFLPRGVNVSAEEIFISDGAKSDIGNFQELFGEDAVVALTDPVYPVYEDSNAMSGRAGTFRNGRWSRLVYLPCTRANGFQPELPETRPDVIYLCSPNNPTGTVLDRESLTSWVNYARQQECLILFDAAYESFIRDDSLPHSIYEIPGADEVAVEFRSLSKTAGFTGLRCGYAVVPEKISARTADGRTLKLHDMWLRRQCTKMNGVAYPIQRAAEAVFTPEGMAACREDIAAYLRAAAIVADGLDELGIWYCGGKNSPYIWMECPNGQDSWQFFDALLENAGIVGTPGSGFGKNGEGYFRLSAFSGEENARAAMERLRAWMQG